jgi:hypothetical protein
MTTHLANPFDQIVSTPHVVPQAVERVIQASVDADYLNRRLVEAARSELLKAMDWFHHVRKGGFPTEIIASAVQRRYRAADRVVEAQNMAGNVFIS